MVNMPPEKLNYKDQSMSMEQSVRPWLVPLFTAIAKIYTPAFHVSVRIGTALMM